MQSRDQLILDHIGRYRLSLRPVLDHLFFTGDSSGCGNVLNRLMRDNYIRAREGLPKRRRYYQLTRRGAEGRVPLDRCRLLRGQTLRSCLGILWFCCMTDGARRRLEIHELERIFDPPPTGPHCGERGQVNRIYRVRVVGTKTRPNTLVQSLRQLIREAHATPKLGAWLQNRNYGFAVLAERKERVEQLGRVINRARLNEHAHILTAEVPGAQNLARSLALWKKNNSRP